MATGAIKHKNEYEVFLDGENITNSVKEYSLCIEPYVEPYASVLDKPDKKCASLFKSNRYCEIEYYNGDVETYGLDRLEIIHYNVEY